MGPFNCFRLTIVSTHSSFCCTITNIFKNLLCLFYFASTLVITCNSKDAVCNTSNGFIFGVNFVPDLVISSPHQDPNSKGINMSGIKWMEVIRMSLYGGV